MTRISKKDALGMFNRLARAMNKTVGHYKEVGKGKNRKYKVISGGWKADYNSVYGGFVIEEIDPQRTGSTGVSRPLGDQRLSIKEFYWACYMTARALEYKRRKR